MKEATNVPYVKAYDENGKVNNFPKDGVKNDGSNRGNRKVISERFLNNSKSSKIMVVKTSLITVQKFRKFIQFIGKKQVIHYATK